MTPEQKARASIDVLLVASGWHVCNVSEANIHASTSVAIREFPLNTDFGFTDYLLYVSGQAYGVIEAKKQGAALLAWNCKAAATHRASRTVCPLGAAAALCVGKPRRSYDRRCRGTRSELAKMSPIDK
jgi:type I restriction enzyme R subunit